MKKVTVIALIIFFIWFTTILIMCVGRFNTYYLNNFDAYNFDSPVIYNVIKGRQFKVTYLNLVSQNGSGLYHDSKNETIRLLNSERFNYGNETDYPGYWSSQGNTITMTDFDGESGFKISHLKHVKGHIYIAQLEEYGDGVRGLFIP